MLLTRKALGSVHACFVFLFRNGSFNFVSVVVQSTVACGLFYVFTSHSNTML